MMRVVALLVVLGMGGIATTLTPRQHDFGKVIVNTPSPNGTFAVTLSPGALATDSINVVLTGADAADFHTSTGWDFCTTRSRSGVVTPGACTVVVGFKPSSPGPKSAVMHVIDMQNRTVSATLQGEGINPLCTMTVVLCNYAFMYNGTFQWRSVLQGDYGSNTKNITVTIQGGNATCDGAETEVNISVVGNQRHSTTNSGRIYGDGLVAVELTQDSLRRPAYQVTVACPSPAWPAALGRARQLAELGSSYEEKSYPIRLVLTPGYKPGFPGDTLVGSRNEPHPDTDPTNNVSGSIVVSWKLITR